MCRSMAEWGNCNGVWRHVAGCGGMWRSFIKTNLPIAVTEMFCIFGQNLVWAAIIEAVFFVRHIFLWPLKLYSSACPELLFWAAETELRVRLRNLFFGRGGGH